MSSLEVLQRNNKSFDGPVQGQSKIRITPTRLIRTAAGPFDADPEKENSLYNNSNVGSCLMICTKSLREERIQYFFYYQFGKDIKSVGTLNDTGRLQICRIFYKVLQELSSRKLS